VLLPDVMTSRVSLTFRVALAFAAAAPIVASAVDVPLNGGEIRLADSPRPQGRRNLVGLIDPSLDLSSVDPSVTGATVYIGPVTGPATVLDLPASGWNRTGNAPRLDFKYKSRAGAIRAARLIDGRSIRFTAKGEGAYALDGTPQEAIGVVIEIGGTRFCSTFGGTITRNDGQRFQARNAGAPASCSSFGATTTTTTSSTTTTTSSSTSTTSSTTTTTRPYTLVQSYMNRCIPFNYLELELPLPAVSFDDAYAKCVALCDSDTRGCVKMWVAYEDCTAKTGPYMCLTGAADPGPLATFGWTASEIQCNYPPGPTCAGWYALVQP
jgi:hypothetical protein